jgi:N-dimethylarginine dimethylaminohydrolase
VKKAIWAQEALKILPKSEGEKALTRSGKNAREIDKYEKVEQENQTLIALLEKHGVKIQRPVELTIEQVSANFGTDFVNANGFQTSYARDPIAVIGRNVIELAMGSAMRCADILGYCSLLRERVLDSNAIWYAMPTIDFFTMARGSYDKNRFPVLEGGDIIVLGKKILVGTSKNPGVGSSLLGITWLQSVLGFQGYDVTQQCLTIKISTPEN